MIKDCDVRFIADRRGNPRAAVIDNLDAHRPRREQATHERATTVQPRPDGQEPIAGTQRLPPVPTHITSERDLAIVLPDNTLPGRKRNQDLRHDRHSDHDCASAAGASGITTAELSGGRGDAARLPLRLDKHSIQKPLDRGRTGDRAEAATGRPVEPD